ncbi:hypothetical protein FUAX_08120 [Fulvitalea axinellae]|uniref:DUF4905 domain-containing protein n=1 Tax=Fulvitalea axinellae TaxID=1182444 RepID=A0AAU9DC30_9BACT|nr:hypothetical protein FUAX_08120 [Fulvitalea axinellae]
MLKEYPFEGKIWKSLADPYGSRLALEIRDEENRQTYYAVIDAEKNDLVGESVSLEEEWWTGLSGISGDTLLVHTYEGRSNPDYQTLYAINILTGEISWEADKFVLSACDRDFAYGFVLSEGERHFGKIKLDSGEYTALENEGRPAEADPQWRFATRYEEEDTHFETVKAFFRQKKGVEAVRCFEYFENEKAVAISYYLKKDAELENRLLLMTLTGEEIFDQELDTGKGVASDTFFLFGDSSIFYIRHKSNLCVYDLDNLP